MVIQSSVATRRVAGENQAACIDRCRYDGIRVTRRAHGVCVISDYDNNYNNNNKGRIRSWLWHAWIPSTSDESRLHYADAGGGGESNWVTYARYGVLTDIRVSLISVYRSDVTSLSVWYRSNDTTSRSLCHDSLADGRSVTTRVCRQLSPGPRLY